MDNRLPRDLLSRKGARLGVTNDEPLAYDTLRSRAGDPKGAEIDLLFANLHCITVNKAFLLHCIPADTAF